MAVVALLLLRAIATRHALDRRARVVLVPADGFDPDPEAVIRFAAGLARARRLGELLGARAHAVRVLLDTDPGGRLRYAVELPEHARPALRAALAGYADVELHDADVTSSEPAAGGGEGEVARVELVLARASVEPLRDVGIDPDPLAGIARALAGLRPEDETAIVCADLLPTTPARRRRLRRRMLRDARRHHREERPDPLGALLGDGSGGRGRGRAAPAELVARRSGQRALSDKLGSPEPLFEIQLLLRTSSPVRGRAVLRLEALMAAFDVFAGENHFRAAGLRLPGGRVFLGADTPWRGGRFDRRARTGLFAPARRRIVTATEIAALLKPPTASCKASNVLRSGGTIPPAPRQLPAFTTDRAELACPGAGTTTRDRLIANFLVYDVLHAAKTRATLDPARRRPFYVFLDEVQVYDGASSGNLAALLEQTAKYGLRAFLFNQNPDRLTPATLNAVTTNRSHLLTTTLNARGAATLGREFAGQIDPEVLTRLQRYTFVASVTLDGAATPPFLVHGIPAHDLFDRTDQPLAPPAAGAPVAETLAALDTLDRRILERLRGPGPEVSRARSRRPA